MFHEAVINRGHMNKQTTITPKGIVLYGPLSNLEKTYLNTVTNFHKALIKTIDLEGRRKLFFWYALLTIGLIRYEG